MSEWGGRKVAQLVALTLGTKGSVCHLCGLEGADSADHNPPRSVLVASGVANPDDPGYLFPAHRRPCNHSRGARPITDELRAELRAKRLAFVDEHQVATTSARFARTRPTFLRAATTAEGSPAISIPGGRGKNRRSGR